MISYHECVWGLLLPSGEKMFLSCIIIIIVYFLLILLLFVVYLLHSSVQSEIGISAKNELQYICIGVHVGQFLTRNFTIEIPKMCLRSFRNCVSITYWCWSAIGRIQVHFSYWYVGHNSLISKFKWSLSKRFVYVKNPTLGDILLTFLNHSNVDISLKNPVSGGYPSVHITVMPSM